MPFETNDTDVEVYITGEVPSFIIEVYIPDDRKYSIAADVTAISDISRQLDKKQGVVKIGDVTLQLKNDNNQYSRTSATSIFYNKQVVKDWVRIKSGWGVDWGNDIETQFQGRIKLLEQNNQWRARMVVYDALQDLKDASLTVATTIGDTEVPGQNPIDILEYLIVTVFGLTWWNMDTLASDALLDPTSLATAKVATEGIKIGETTWPIGAKCLDMAADLMKMCNGYIYSGKDGRLNVYVYAPSMDADSARSEYSFVGDVTVKEPEILISKLDQNLDTVINQVNWKYGQNSTEYACAKEETSDGRNGPKTLELTTGWDLYPVTQYPRDTSILDAVAGRIYSRFSEPVDTYELSLSWLRNGDALEMDLTDIVALTDPALNGIDEYVEVHRLRVAIDRQVTQAIAYDASAMQGKFWWWSSEVDEKDGLGVTGGNFAVNWLRRFLFWSMPDSHFNPGFDTDGNNNGRIDPEFPPIDDWGSGIEEHFIWW